MLLTKSRAVLTQQSYYWSTLSNIDASFNVRVIVRQIKGCRRIVNTQSSVSQRFLHFAGAFFRVPISFGAFLSVL
jgi:hypothetical protein